MKALFVQFFAFFHINSLDDFKAFVLQFMKFALVGLLNTFVGYGIYYILVYSGVYHLIANTISYAISIVFSYMLNLKFVFNGSKENRIKILIRTYIVYFLSFLISSTMLYLLIDISGISKYIAPIIILFITTPLNFLLNKFWAYKTPK